MPWLVFHILHACVCCQLLIHNHKIELTKFEIRVLPKHYWKKDYKDAAAARRICQVKGKDVVSKRVAQRWFQRFKTGKANTKDLPRSARPKLKNIENIRRVVEGNPQ